MTQPTNDRRTAAGLLDRCRAFALDYLVIAGYLTVLVAAAVALGQFVPSMATALFGGPVVGQVAGFALVTLPVTLYFALSEASAGQGTWGKRRLRLTVSDASGRHLGLTRSLARSVLKFVPWEVAHADIWQVRFAADPSAPVYLVGFLLVWILLGANVVSILLSPTRQTLYDKLTGSFVRRAGEPRQSGTV